MGLIPKILKKYLDRGWQWDGTIASHVFRGELSAAEYLRLVTQSAGLDSATPHALAQDGTPLYVLPSGSVKRAQSTLTRLCTDTFLTHNVACNNGRSALLNFVANAGGLTGVQYFAIGTGTSSTGPTSGDTQLFSEQFRKAPTATLISGNSITITCLFGTGEGNYNMTEAGLFGDGATTTANSGQLFAHASYFYNKTSAVTLSNQYTIQFN